MSDLERFRFDPSKPIESQIRAFLNGRNPYGTVGTPNNTNSALFDSYAVPDESGTATYGYRSKNPRVADLSPGNGGGSPIVIDRHYSPVNWAHSDSPDAVNGLKPDSLNSYDNIYYDPEFGLITEGNNLRDPDARHDLWYGAGIMGAVAAPALAGILAAGGAGAGGAGAASGSGLTPLSGVSLAPETSIGTLGQVGGGAGAAGGAAGAAGGGGGGLAALGGSAGSGLTPLTGVSLAPETSIGTVGSVGGAAGGGGSLLSQAGNALASNPGQAARLGLGLAALGGAAHNSSGTAAATTDANSIIDQMANANRVDQNTPLGSRRWAQDPATGRWTVNDTMNPAEQANFENVQGLNASGTDFSKQFLARLLAAPPTPTAGHSFTVNGRTIGG
jgi:hypothetical protein